METEGISTQFKEKRSGKLEGYILPFKILGKNKTKHLKLKYRNT